MPRYVPFKYTLVQSLLLAYLLGYAKLVNCSVWLPASNCNVMSRVGRYHAVLQFEHWKTWSLVESQS